MNEDVTSRSMFWINTASFTLYNALVGYLLMQREHAGALEVALFTLAMALLVAFLAGCIILNVLKKELPEERESRFAPFLLGTAGYASLLLII